MHSSPSSLLFLSCWYGKHEGPRSESEVKVVTLIFLPEAGGLCGQSLPAESDESEGEIDDGETRDLLADLLDFFGESPTARGLCHLLLIRKQTF